MRSPTQISSWSPAPSAHYPPPQILTSGGQAGQPAVDAAEDSGREWVVQWEGVEGGAGHPESQLVRASEESEPRPLTTPWAAGKG